MIAKNKKKFLISIVILLLIAGSLLSFRGSGVNTNFPVPQGAELTRQDVKEGYEEYNWSPAS
ncbi:hypothetical protein L2D08_19465 [Domibacillus sp. PGB-M46]|uniref:hypothetical protein n=1 Tax=Domibacillus sp. PGB-M46 TaxID=2910255 RepID=UPI001F597C85|nr:hypothetical protein [Domibacillus sp. PGB-M46]MCI2256521.1 hypothetical protein [Domibacillus sp. PGB-M46]